MDEFDKGVSALASKNTYGTYQQDLRAEWRGRSEATCVETPTSPSVARGKKTLDPRMRGSVPVREVHDGHKIRRYTIEQTDFLIYCVHEQRMSWGNIHKIFPLYFPSSPRRGLRSLRCAYSRLNKNVPAYSHYGELIFDHDLAIHPLYVDITSRNKEDIKPIGLAQRYPDRAALYPWVDVVTKTRAIWFGQSVRRCMVLL